MNTLFKPTKKELDLIIELREIIEFDFSYFRVTETMINKSIIDASLPIRNILKENKIINYEHIEQGEKLYLNCLLFTGENIVETRTSFYKPNTKSGDPRFWPSMFSKYVNINDLILFTSIEDKCVLIIIKLELKNQLIKSLQRSFNTDSSSILNELKTKLKNIKNDGWIESISPYDKQDNAVGLTIENALNINPNSSTSPDYKNKIEVKSKGKGKTKDTLFSKVPNWDLSTKKENSNIPLNNKKSAYYLLEFGIPSANHPDYKTLYVTVSTTPNPQGMYLETSDQNQRIYQHFSSGNHILASCIWEYSILEKCLYAKHGKTVWAKANERINNGKIQFKYLSFEFSERPSFNTFISLIPLNIITVDWTHRVLPNGSKYNDHGFLWRIDPRYRNLLFKKVVPIVTT